MRSLRTFIRGWLQRHGLNERFRDTALYGGYLRLRFPRYADRKRRELNVYRQLIDRPGPVFDIGANVGEKAILFTKVAKDVVCIEPDRTCVDGLRRRFRRHAGVHIIHSAVSESNGVTAMYQLADASPYNTTSRKWMTIITGRIPQLSQATGAPRSVEVPTITLDRLISTYGTPAFVKIDVEGGELAVVRGLSAPVPLLSFESILPEFCDDTLEILDRLQRLDPNSAFNYCLDDPDPELASDRWLSHEEMTDFVRRGTGCLMEIYCRQLPPLDALDRGV